MKGKPRLKNSGVGLSASLQAWQDASHMPFLRSTLLKELLNSLDLQNQQVLCHRLLPVFSSRNMCHCKALWKQPEAPNPERGLSLTGFDIKAIISGYRSETATETKRGGTVGGIMSRPAMEMAGQSDGIDRQRRRRGRRRLKEQALSPVPHRG